MNNIRKNALKKLQKKHCDKLSESECDDSHMCKFDSEEGECVLKIKMSKSKFAEDEEDIYFDSSEDLFDFEEDYDLDEDSEYLVGPDDEDDEDEDAKEQKKYEQALKKYNDAKHECKDLSESECVEEKKCEFDSKKGKCGPEMKKPHEP